MDVFMVYDSYILKNQGEDVQEKIRIQLLVLNFCNR